MKVVIMDSMSVTVSMTLKAAWIQQSLKDATVMPTCPYH